MYPSAREKFDAVGLDKLSFGEPDKLQKKLKLTNTNTNEKKVKYLSQDPGSKYTSNYSEKNIQNVR